MLIVADELLQGLLVCNLIDLLHVLDQHIWDPGFNILYSSVNPLHQNLLTSSLHPLVFLVELPLYFCTLDIPYRVATMSWCFFETEKKLWSLKTLWIVADINTTHTILFSHDSFKLIQAAMVKSKLKGFCFFWRLPFSNSDLILKIVAE